MTMSEGDLAVTEIRFVRGATIAARRFQPKQPDHANR